MKQLTTGASKWKELRCKICAFYLLIENVSAVQYLVDVMYINILDYAEMVISHIK